MSDRRVIEALLSQMWGEAGMTVSKSFYAVAIVFLLWSLMGDAAYIMQATQDLDALAKTDAYQAQLFREMPIWAWASYAVAVWIGLAASILLLLRRKIAAPFYAISLIATIIQFGRIFIAIDIIAVKGLVTAAFPAFIILMGIIELLYSRSAKAKGWLR